MWNYAQVSGQRLLVSDSWDRPNVCQDQLERPGSDESEEAVKVTGVRCWKRLRALTPLWDSACCTRVCVCGGPLQKSVAWISILEDFRVYCWINLLLNVEFNWSPFFCLFSDDWSRLLLWPLYSQYLSYCGGFSCWSWIKVSVCSAGYKKCFDSLTWTGHGVNKTTGNRQQRQLMLKQDAGQLWWYLLLWGLNWMPGTDTIDLELVLSSILQELPSYVLLPKGCSSIWPVPSLWYNCLLALDHNMAVYMFTQHFEIWNPGSHPVYLHSTSTPINYLGLIS